LGGGKKLIHEDVQAAGTGQERVTDYFDSQALYWKEIYERRDAFSVTYQQRMATVLAWVDGLTLTQGSRILEVGCGAGFTTVALTERGFLVEAQDAAGAMVELTRRHAEDAGVADCVKASVGRVHRLAFPDGTFPLVLAIGVMPWIHAPDVAVRELARVVQPGGYLLFTVDNRWRLHYLLNPLRTPLFDPVRWLVRSLRAAAGFGAGGPLNRQHSIRQADAFVRDAGLEKLRSKTLGFGPFRFFHFRLFSDDRGIKLHETLQGWADRGVPLIHSMGGQYLVLAQKPRDESALRLRGDVP
jgi:ubiquinone/menaquinone biosynthesis C-methylase UbiE